MNRFSGTSNRVINGRSLGRETFHPPLLPLRQRFTLLGSPSLSLSLWIFPFKTMASEARELIAKAEKKLSTGSSWFGQLTGSHQHKVDDAAQLYIDAGNKFKQDKCWKEAGDAFMKASELLISIKESDIASIHIVNAAACYKKFDPAFAIPPLSQAMDLLADR